MVSRLHSLVSRLAAEPQKALNAALSDLVTRTHYTFEIEHFMLALLTADPELQRLLTLVDVDPNGLESRLRAALDAFNRGSRRTPSFSLGFQDLLLSSWVAASLDLDARQITTGAILLGLADEKLQPYWRDAMPELRGMSPDKVLALLKSVASAAGPAPKPSGPADRVFLSYRRNDAEAMAQMLFYCLLNQVDGIKLFRDSDTLQPGMVYADMIDQTIANCDVVLVLIGKKWLNAKHADGSLRLADADDLVRLEVASALRQRKKVVPCLLNGARMPKADQLPEDLQALTRFHATPLSQSSFDRDVQPLVDVLKRLGAKAPVAD